MTHANVMAIMPDKTTVVITKLKLFFSNVKIVWSNAKLEYNANATMLSLVKIRKGMVNNSSNIVAIITIGFR